MRLLAGQVSALAQRPVILMGLVTLIGLLLRLVTLSAKSLVYDEAMNWWISSGSFREVFARNAAMNSYPPLFSFVLAVVRRLSSSEAALRLVPALAGAAAVPAMYVLARRFTTPAGAVFAAVLVALSPQQVVYSQQVRVYSLAVLLAIFLLWATSRFLDRPDGRGTAALACALVVGLVTHYGLALLAAAIGLVTVATLAQRRAPSSVWIRWMSAQFVGLLTVAVVDLSTLRNQVAAGAGGLTGQYTYLAEGFANGSLRSMIHLALLQTPRILELAYPSALVVFLVALGLTLGGTAGTARRAIYLLVVPLAITFAAAVMHVYPYMGSRQDLFLTPMIYVVASVGFVALGAARNGRRVALVASLLLIGYGLREDFWHYQSAGPEPIRPIVDELEKRIQQGDRIYVYDSRAFDYYTRNRHYDRVLGVSPQEDSARAYSQFDHSVRDAGPVWLVFSHIRDEDLAALLQRVPEERRLQVVAKREGAALYLIQ